MYTENKEITSEIMDALKAEEKLNNASTGILRALNDTTKNFIKIGYYLLQIKDIDFKLFGYEDIYDFSLKNFSLKKTSIKNMLGIANRFIDNDRTYYAEQIAFKEGFEGFNYSQLTELLSVDDMDIKKFTPSMPRSEIREQKYLLKMEDSILEIVEQDVSLCEKIVNDFRDIFDGKQDISAKTPSIKKGKTEKEITSYRTCWSQKWLVVGGLKGYPVVIEYVYRNGNRELIFSVDSKNYYISSFKTYRIDLNNTEEVGVEYDFEEFLNGVFDGYAEIEQKEEKKQKEDNQSDQIQEVLEELFASKEPLFAVEVNRRLKKVGLEIEDYKFFIDKLTIDAKIYLIPGYSKNSFYVYWILPNNPMLAINAGGYYSGTPILLYKMKYSEEGFLTNNIKHHFIKDVNLEYKDMDSFKNCVCDYLFSNLDKIKEENKLNEEEESK